MVAWKERILKMFPDRRVTVVQCAQLVGLFQLIVTKGLVVRDSELQFVKTGLGGFHGNKGALVTRFMLGDSGFVFVNCHLAAHQSEVLARNSDIHQILKDCTFTLPTAKLLWNRGGDGSKILVHVADGRITSLCSGVET
jgi:hypothetical protein